MKKYINFILFKILNFISPIIRIWESILIKKYSVLPLKHEPVFIVGAPRTGSTILYQVLTNELDSIYINNLTCKFFRNSFFGMWLSSKFYRYKAHNTFNSKYGDTNGLNSPSECGQFWYRWLPKDIYFLKASDIKDEIRNEIRDEVTAIINYHDKPLIIKNLGMGQRLDLLKDVFPNAKIIYIDRNPILTAQSILKARLKQDYPENKIWSIKPKNYLILESYSLHSQIIGQIYYLQKQILEDLGKFSNTFQLNYSDLNDKIKLISCKKFITSKNRDNYEDSVINNKEKLTLNLNEINILESEIKKYDWTNYDK
ncbi:sulfotransferase [Sulfurimonas lithotrophica]|uniref:Sulfotransferase n=1 Tax=Sulfurimonas lithotrophica TaxID=2590022 RepID=A0A5P8NZV8_9BACT|nr:sulfotransferase [Sulfurimonas lithotrophica]QFR48887.1 sulfotransferase [Sulfurimonas lithotrophica]